MQHELIICNTVETIRVSAMDIVGIKAEGNYSTIIFNDGEERLVLFQLGQLETMITEQLGAVASMFIRIGRGIIINREYLFIINLPRQVVVLRTSSGIKTTLSASRESLRQLKLLIDNSINNGKERG